MMKKMTNPRILNWVDSENASRAATAFILFEVTAYQSYQRMSFWIAAYQLRSDDQCWWHDVGETRDRSSAKQIAEDYFIEHYPVEALAIQFNITRTR